jgi:proline iminopeptidase
MMTTVPGRHGVVRSGRFQLGYVVEGQGRPVMVIGSSVYYPRTFSKGLRSTLQLAFVDHRGFAPCQGSVEAADGAFGTVVDDIDLMRRELGFDQVVALGHSGHGYMALEYAKRYRRNVSHVVMIATGPSHSAAQVALTERHWSEAVCPERKARLEADLELLPQEIASAPERRFISFCIRLGARSWYDPGFDAAPLWAGVQVNMPIIDHLWGEVFRDIDVTRGLEELDLPVFLALGRFDYLVSPISPGSRCAIGSGISPSGCSTGAAMRRSLRRVPPSTASCLPGWRVHQPTHGPDPAQGDGPTAARFARAVGPAFQLTPKVSRCPSPDRR